jgi:phytoene synthase
MSLPPSAGTETAAAATKAAKTSFYAAMRILPAAQRDGMYEIYAFCRAVDDIADDGGPRPARHAALDGWRADLAALYAGAPPARLASLARTVQAFGLRQADFLAIIDGMDMDVAADIQAPDFATLDLYCDRVASAVGRLAVRIFGVPEAEGDGLAHHLGRALQLTNILRDLDEDAAIERLYLPREALRAAGIEATAPAEVVAHPRLGEACEPVIARARGHFAEADAIMGRCPRKTVKAPRIMAAAYRPILERVVGRGFAPPRTRVRTPKHRVLLAALRYGLV